MLSFSMCCTASHQCRAFAAHCGVLLRCGPGPTIACFSRCVRLCYFCSRRPCTQAAFDNRRPSATRSSGRHRRIGRRAANRSRSWSDAGAALGSCFAGIVLRRGYAPCRGRRPSCRRHIAQLATAGRRLQGPDHRPPRVLGQGIIRPRRRTLISGSARSRQRRCRVWARPSRSVSRCRAPGASAAAELSVSAQLSGPAGPRAAPGGQADLADACLGHQDKQSAARDA